jgi:hypothetical protein
MSELDWLQREERYRQRFGRTFVVIAILAALFLGVGSWKLQGRQKAAEQAAAQEKARILRDETAKQRAAFVADSTAAATRVAAFREKYGAQPLEGAPIFMVPLPFKASVPRFLQEVWEAYTHAVDPTLTPDQQREEFGVRYVDVMNLAYYNSANQIVWQGEMRPQALLLPDVRQRGKDLDWEKPSFPQIVRGQETVGLRAPSPDAGSAGVGEVPAGSDSAATTQTPPAPSPPAAPIPPQQSAPQAPPPQNPPAPSPAPAPSPPETPAQNPPTPNQPAQNPPPAPPDSQPAPKP